MPTSWRRQQLDQVADINPESVGAGTPLNFRFNYIDLTSTKRGEIDWSRVGEQVYRSAPSRARRVVREGDVLFGTVRPALQSHGYVEGRNQLPCVASTGFSVIRARAESSTPRFLLHSVLGQSISAQARRREVGSNYPAVNESDVARFEIKVPPLPEQGRIAEILDTLDDAIRKTEQAIEKLKRMKQGLLHDLLTRGIDDNGELRDPKRHPEQFRDSPLGWLPSAWRVEHLGEVSDFLTSGSRGWAAYYSESGPLFLRIGNLTREHINLRLDSLIHVQPPPGSEGRRTSALPGDLLLSITADLGIVGVVPGDLGEAYVNQHIALVRVNPQGASARWLGHYLAGAVGQRQFTHLNDQGAKAGMNLPTVAHLLVAVPPRREQEAVAAAVDSHDEQIHRAILTFAKLRTLKHGLMDDLLTGRVRVQVPAETTR